MNKNDIDAFVDSIFTEALTAGPDNVVKGTDNSAPGQVSRQMLAGEFMGSVAWPFQQPKNPDLAGATELMNKHSVSGLGEMVGAVIESVIDEDFSYLSDESSVGYLINALDEAGFNTEASFICALIEEPKEEHIAKLTEMADAIAKNGGDAFLVEQVKGLAGLVKETLTENVEDTPPAGDTEVSHDEGQADMDPEKGEPAPANS